MPMQKAFDIFCHGNRAKSGTVCMIWRKKRICIVLTGARTKGCWKGAGDMVQLVEVLSEALGWVSV